MLPWPLLDPKVTNYNTAATCTVRISHVLQMCSNFLAGDALRSSHRFRSLDETAILGTACRHEMPLLFVNLKHGER